MKNIDLTEMNESLAEELGIETARLAIHESVRKILVEDDIFGNGVVYPTSTKLEISSISFQKKHPGVLVAVSTALSLPIKILPLQWCAMGENRVECARKRTTLRIKLPGNFKGVHSRSSDFVWDWEAISDSDRIAEKMILRDRFSLNSQRRLIRLNSKGEDEFIKSEIMEHRDTIDYIIDGPTESQKRLHAIKWKI